MESVFQSADTDESGSLSLEEFTNSFTMENNVYFTVGRSGCGYTIKQAQANNANGPATILCSDPSITKTMGDDFNNMCANLPSLEAVPANFTCSGPPTEDFSNCTMELGFNPTFGKPK